MNEYFRGRIVGIENGEANVRRIRENCGEDFKNEIRRLNRILFE